MSKTAQRGIIKPIALILIFLAAIVLAGFAAQRNELSRLQNQNSLQENNNQLLTKKLALVSGELKKLKETDQIKRNDALEEEIKNIEGTYKKSVSIYQDLLDLKIAEPKLDKKFDTQLASAISQLANKNFASADASLNSLASMIKTENDKFIAASTPNLPTAPNNPTSNAPPNSGYSRQTAHTDSGDFLVDIVAGLLSSTKVTVDTASDSTCTNNCPAFSLADYVSRNGAYAGVNGSYFCPAEYPSCSGKTNSFDTLLMNKNKVYFNSDNNVYSTIPAAIFGNGWSRFVGRSSNWGRDTNVDAVIANHPLLVQDGKIVASDYGEAKLQIKSNRGFVAATGSTAYIGVVYNVTVFESAKVLQTLGIQNALNLDSGGSTAFWFGGYKTGPGRNIPNAVLFVRK